MGIVIPVFNRRSILLETLEFVLRQSYSPTCLVIVDDGSSDGTAEAAEEFLRDRQPAFEWQILRLQHTKAAHARNVGFQKVQDLDYIAFLDSDDHWPPDFLARACGALDADHNAMAASTDREYFSRTSVEKQETNCCSLADDPIPWFFKYGAGVASCSLFRSKTIADLGGWDVELKTSEDLDLFSKVALRGPWLHLPGRPVVFNMNAGDSSDSQETNLSRRHADSHQRWAQVYEMVYQRVCKCGAPIKLAPLRESLAYRWCSAGKQQIALGNIPAAKACLRRSLHWQPTYFKSWRRLARLAIPFPIRHSGSAL